MMTEMTLSTFCTLLVVAGSLGVVLMFVGGCFRSTAVALLGGLCSASFAAGLYWLAVAGPLVVR